MTNDDKKDFNKKLNDKKNMPKIVELDNEGAKKWGGNTMVIAPPIDYDELIKQIPKGQLVTTNELRQQIAKKYKTDITCPLTAGIFVNICAWASFQRNENITPYWRVLKRNGELNNKFPKNYKLQKEELEKEGHTIIQNKDKYYVKDFEKYIYNFNV